MGVYGRQRSLTLEIATAQPPSKQLKEAARSMDIPEDKVKQTKAFFQHFIDIKMGHAQGQQARCAVASPWYLQPRAHPRRHQ